ncbi:YdeI/OmpD-associated family protein [Streptomyces sp. NPDC059629]|uniref:YdeI/OmpD-associated family protein n=1 Tax=Streptomyces sp. NPDC059629 TaxID=3346889 RepID=UPI00368313C1
MVLTEPCLERLGGCECDDLQVLSHPSSEPHPADRYDAFGHGAGFTWSPPTRQQGAARPEPQSEAGVPEDLAAALERNPEAGTAFDALGRTGRYQVIFGLLTARTPQGRANRLAAALAGLSSRPRT